MSLIDTEYINFLKNHFCLNWKGIHGAPHWARMRANGLLFAEQTLRSLKSFESSCED